jgi:hypothetical protein
MGTPRAVPDTLSTRGRRGELNANLEEVN